MIQSKNSAEKPRRAKRILLSCVALTIALAAMAAAMTGCETDIPSLSLTEVTLSRDDKNAIASVITYNCFFDYDSSKPEEESTAIMLTIGPMYGCWDMYVREYDDKLKHTYFNSEDDYVRDPLKAFDADDENGITGYSKYDGKTVDKLLKGVFNMKPTHSKTPQRLDYTLISDNYEQKISPKYYYYKGYYYLEDVEGICASDGYGISFDAVVTDGVNYYIKYKRQYAVWLDEKTEINPDPGEVHNPIETAYAVFRKNKIDGEECWSIVKLTDEQPLDFSVYRKSEQDNKWKKLYIDHIRQYDPENSVTEFTLAYIDGDEIPELIAETGFTYSGGEVSTVYNGALKSLGVWTYGVSYIDRQNAMLSSGGHMDDYYYDVYKIEKGKFVKTAGGIYGLDENFDYDKDYAGGEIEDYYKYRWNDKSVSKGQYKKLLKKAFDASLATNPYNCTLSESTMIYRLENDFYEIYPLVDYSSEDVD